MRSGIIRCWILLFIFIFSAAGIAEESTSQPTVLRAARLWDGRASAPIQNGIVIIEGRTSRQVGPDLTIPRGATVIELGDTTLLPGFIDLHVHTTGEIGENYVQS